MLTTLCIQHFAIVKQLELDFTQGMTAFTGETGAGKSIMIDALMLALGSRADASVIRPGADKCDITATFHFDLNSPPALWLAEQEIACPDQELYLRRVITLEGRSKSYINGQPVPLQKVKELSEKLVHIHGQHQHQTLMHHSTHRQQLDQYANNQQLLEDLSGLFKQYQKLEQEIERLSLQEQQEDKIQLLQFQIDELSALNIQEHEVQSLHQEHQLLHHAREYLQHSQQINALLNEDDTLTICSALNQALQLIGQLPQDNKHIKNSFELINSALIQCEEAVNEMQEFAERVPLDPQRLQQVEERMSTIHHVARKYHIESSQLLEHMIRLEQQLDALQNSKNKLKELQQQLIVCTKNYKETALKLTAARQLHAKKLAQELTTIIQKLGMPKGWIELDITPTDKIQAHGLDKVEYKVCTNPGMPPDTLSKIASGGELSRISLAIQMITAQRGSTPTLLFDEVDVGIGGSTAALVGQMLRKLGERLQVFCVTHQPQVASCAHNHFVVTKQSDDTQTSTQVVALEMSSKIDEIARMLGGLKITEQTRSHAQELLLQSI